MNASCAQCSRYIVAATASTVSATLRTLMCASDRRVGASGLAAMRDLGGSVPACQLSVADRQSGLRLQRLVDRDARLRSLGGGDDGELDVAGGIADDIDAGDARLAEMIGLDGSLARELAPEPLREIALLRLR